MASALDRQKFYPQIVSAQNCDGLIKKIQGTAPAEVERLYGSTVVISKLFASDQSRRLAAWIFAQSIYHYSACSIREKPAIQWKELLFEAVRLNTSANRKIYIVEALFNLHMKSWESGKSITILRRTIYTAITNLVLKTLVHGRTKVEVDENIAAGYLEIVKSSRSSKENRLWLKVRPDYIRNTLKAVKDYFIKQLGISFDKEEKTFQLDQVLKAGFINFSQLTSPHLSIEDIIGKTNQNKSLFLEACKRGCLKLIEEWVEKFGITVFLKDTQLSQGLINVGLLCQSEFLMQQLIENKIITTETLLKANNSGGSICRDLLQFQLKISVEYCVKHIGITPFISTPAVKDMLLDRAVLWKSHYLLENVIDTKNITIEEITKDCDIRESLFNKVVDNRLFKIVERWVKEFGVEPFVANAFITLDLLIIAIEESSEFLLKKLFNDKRIGFEYLLMAMEKDDCIMQQCIDKKYYTAVKIIVESYGIEPFVTDSRMRRTLEEVAKQCDSRPLQQYFLREESRLLDELTEQMFKTEL